jgi:hypothetical protein
MYGERMTTRERAFQWAIQVTPHNLYDLSAILQNAEAILAFIDGDEVA